MNQIANVENSPESLEQLAAQREIYSFAKNFYSLQTVGSIIIPIIFSGVALFIPDVSAYSALYGVCFSILDITLIETMINKAKSQAAKIQELFDCNVLDIPASAFKNADDILLEEIPAGYEKHKKKNNSIDKLRGWYSNDLKEISSLPISTARLICQRKNLWWDSELRTRYSNTLKIFSLILFLILIVAGFAGHIKFEQFVLIFSGLLPLFRFSIKQYLDNKDSSEKLTKVISYFNKIWERVLKSDIDETELEAAARQIQNEIYDNRVKSSLIPDYFYNSYKDKQESLANTVAEKLVKEAKGLTVSEGKQLKTN